MDLFIERAIEDFKKSSNVVLTEKSKKKIYELFPIPREQKILWADNIEKNKVYGMVITDVGIFIKASPKAVKQANEGVDKKDKVSSIYHYFKWEFFNPEDFELKKVEDDRYDIYFNGKRLYNIHKSSNFFKCYTDAYQKIVKEATTSAENIFADLEAVVPENFAGINSKHGHGEMAEEALTLLDKIQGKHAEVVGRTNEKNGADRIVDGVEIQTKYYKTGKGCIDACFDKTTGQFRYLNAKGEPMMIEVPKDKYAEAVNEFRRKILEGRVSGVSNPDDATKYIKKGQLTYKQALNLCKPGTIESLTYDVATGAINCSFAFGISFLTTYILAYSKTGNKKEAFNAAFAAGIQVFGLSFFAHVLTQQVARTALTKQLIPLSTYIVKTMGYKSAQTIVNAIRSMAGKSAISGAAAMKQLAKILRSNVVTSVITLVVFSVPDTYSFFSKKLSTAQYTKNMLSLVGTMAMAGAGTVATSVAAAKIGAATGTAIAPGVGTAVGIVGGAAAGMAGGAVIKAVGDHIREDDTVILSRLYNGVVINLIYEYMLSESEINVLIEKFNNIKAKEFKTLFTNVQAADRQELVIDNFIRHYFEEIIRSRPKLSEPKPDECIEFFKQFEDISEKTAPVTDDSKLTDKKLMEIYNLTPKKNCKECGYHSCMALTLDVKHGKATLRKCPYLSDEVKSKLKD